ncbi:MAG: DUF3443 family protein [Betaproteobacteria bacterium]|nr:DUF3443 family protein [Betaproteobacteria bacterium]
MTLPAAAARLGAAAVCLWLISCGGGGGSSNFSPTSGVANPVIVSIGATPTTLTSGQTATLAWSASNASACQASGAWSGAVGTSGTQAVSPPSAGTFTYTLTCDGISNSTVAVVADSPSPAVSISLTPASASFGQSSTLRWSAPNTSSCIASGAWAGAQNPTGTISVSQASAGNYAYSLTCTGAAGSAFGSAVLAVTGLARNAAQMVLDSGPAGVGGPINVPFVSVTLCRPGTATCQTIDHVVVDTGSFGLRIVSPGVLDPALNLPAVTTPAGARVGECAQFRSGFAWGSVRRADVKIGGETASSLPIQVVSDPSLATIPADCSAVGANIGSVAAFNANGILGIGLFKQDCGTPCALAVIPATYYGCSATSCTGVALPLSSQVANPIAAFPTDNNGVAVVLPAVPPGGATTLSGALVFGIGTQANNQLGSVSVFAADGAGNFVTTYKGTRLTQSFLDTVSNALLFQDATIPACATAPGFYCPATTLSLAAVNASFDGAVTGTVNFSVENPLGLVSTVRAAAVAGGTGGVFGVNTFDWGLPFFFGRTVFVAIAGANTPVGPGPYWAY